jgi:hypothetical protein
VIGVRAKADGAKHMAEKQRIKNALTAKVGEKNVTVAAGDGAK